MLLCGYCKVKEAWYVQVNVSWMKISCAFSSSSRPTAQFPRILLWQGDGDGSWSVEPWLRPSPFWTSSSHPFASSSLPTSFPPFVPASPPLDAHVPSSPSSIAFVDGQRMMRYGHRIAGSFVRNQNQKDQMIVFVSGSHIVGKRMSPRKD